MKRKCKRGVALLLACVICLGSVKSSRVEAAEVVVYSSFQVLEWLYALMDSVYVPPEFLHGLTDFSGLAESNAVVSLLSQIGSYYENCAKDPVTGLLPVPSWDAVVSDLKNGVSLASDAYSALCNGLTDFFDKVLSPAIDYSMPVAFLPEHVDELRDALDAIPVGLPYCGFLIQYQNSSPCVAILAGERVAFSRVHYTGVGGGDIACISVTAGSSDYYRFDCSFGIWTLTDPCSGISRLRSSSLAYADITNGYHSGDVVSCFGRNYVDFGYGNASRANAQNYAAGSYSGDVSPVPAGAQDVITPQGVPHTSADLPALNVPSLAPDIPELDAIKELFDSVTSSAGVTTGSYELVADDVLVGEKVQEYLDSLTDSRPGVGENESEGEVVKPGEQEKPGEDTDGNEIYVSEGLQNVFPFCIPFDLIDCFKKFSATAKAPRFEFPLKSERFGINETVVVDLSPFEPVAEIFRILETIAFIIGLIMITRNLIGS